MKNTIQHLTLTAIALAACTLFSNTVYAEGATAAKPDNEFSFNLGATSDYRFRGISQSRLDPAVQGGADYINNPTGLYLGTWLSSIKWIKDAGGNGNVEWDIYGGKRGNITPDVSYDVGVLTYVYPSNELSTNANTTEIYGQVGYSIATLKYSHSVTNLFGFTDSKNSGYLDLSANFPLPYEMTLGTHVGHQTVRHNGAFSYTDWKVGVSKDFYSVTFNLAVVGSNANDHLYITPAGKFTGRTNLVLTATKAF